MNFPKDSKEKIKQREVLKKIFIDYDPKYHDAFIIKFNKRQDDKAINNYMYNRYII